MTTMTGGFHAGERAVQARAALSREAARLEGMLDPALLSEPVAAFLAAQQFAVLVSTDEEDRLWASPLVGPPGFLDGHDQELRVSARPAADDPLRTLPADRAVGLIAMDLQRRRRFRMNGRVSAVDAAGFTVAATEAYGNCPSYIQQRPLTLASASGAPRPALDSGGVLSPAAIEIVRSADTFFLGTRHPERGADASHKGGNPGFVRVVGGELRWPDYAGNNMFNSLGNLTVDQSAALLFLDFATGAVLQLSGTAHVEWTAPGPAGSDTATGRWVRFHPDRALLRMSGIRSESSPIRSPKNPPVLP